MNRLVHFLGQVCAVGVGLGIFKYSLLRSVNTPKVVKYFMYSFEECFLVPQIGVYFYIPWSRSIFMFLKMSYIFRLGNIG